MGGPLESDSGEMRAVQRLVDGVAEEMRAEFGKLARRGEALVEDWAGVSGSKYREPWEEWKEGCRSVIGALEDEAGLLGESAAEYDRQEGENARSAERVEGLVKRVQW